MSTTSVMLVMVDAGPVRRWWAGPVVGMTRRRGVGRWPARLMFAGFHRRSAVGQEGAPHYPRPRLGLVAQNGRGSVLQRRGAGASWQPRSLRSRPVE
jgi:hypothetical protein